MVVILTNFQTSIWTRTAFRLVAGNLSPTERGRLSDPARIVRVSRRAFLALAILIAYTTNAHAQFGLKCDSPAFAYTLTEKKLSEGVMAAIRSTCDFNKKSAEINQVFGRVGWSWDLLPKAQADIADLEHLANKAAELNFKTGDPRALGNIRNMYIRVGDQQRWLADQQKKFAMRQQRMAVSPPGPGLPTGSSQAAEDQTFVFVIFQDNISDADKDAFLQAYSVSIVGGPNADQSYRLHLGTPLPQDQLPLVLNSMNSQTRVVKTAFAK